MSEKVITSGASKEGIPTTLVALAPALVERIGKNLAPLIEMKTVLRGKLLEDKEIFPFEAKPSVKVESMCAVDGARVKEQMYISDLLVAVATTVNARSAQNNLPSLQSSWADVVRHVDGTDRLAEAAMAAQEVYIAAESDHYIKIMDGSFLTPIIGMTQGLYLKNSAIKEKIADLLLSQWNAPANLLKVVKPTVGFSLAIPKSDSADKYSELYRNKYEIKLDAADRFLASQVLKTGELLKPRKVLELGFNARVDEVEGSARVIEAATALRASVSVISKMASSGQIYTTYFKPYGPEKLGAVIRFEYVVEKNASEDSIIEKAREYAAILNAECAPPHMMEPFAQWAVDRIAKQISSGTPALRATLVKSLPSDQAALLAQNYRT